MTAAEFFGPANPVSVPDCRTCGACCTTGAADGGRGQLAYLPISKAESKRLPPGVVTLAVIEGIGSQRSLRFNGDRCAALDGVVGLSCSCRVYDERPRICRVFPPGSPNCVAARAERGLS